MRYRLLIFVFTGLMGAISLARAQTPPVTVPDQSQLVADDANLSLKKGLDARYGVLLQRFNQWNVEAKAFNIKYGDKNLDADTKDAKDGLAEQARLSKALQDYEHDCEQFKTVVGRLRLKGTTADAGSKGAPPVAKVFAQGEFYFVTKDGRKLTGADATMLPLDGGTHAVTGPDGHLKLLLPDETIFTLGPDSDMVLDDFVYDHNHSMTKAEAHFAKGIFRWVTGKLSQGHEHDVKIKIPIGDVGFRGTDFECMVAPIGSGYVKLFEGQLDITEKKTGAKFILNAGHIVSFTADGAFSQPTLLTP